MAIPHTNLLLPGMPPWPGPPPGQSMLNQQPRVSRGVTQGLQQPGTPWKRNTGAWGRQEWRSCPVPALPPLPAAGQGQPLERANACTQLGTHGAQPEHAPGGPPEGTEGQTPHKTHKQGLTETLPTPSAASLSARVPRSSGSFLCHLCLSVPLRRQGHAHILSRS